jgi:hypothetical protein
VEALVQERLFEKKVLEQQSINRQRGSRTVIIRSLTVPVDNGIGTTSRWGSILGWLRPATIWNVSNDFAGNSFGIVSHGELLLQFL